MAQTAFLPVLTAFTLSVLACDPERPTLLMLPSTQEEAELMAQTSAEDPSDATQASPPEQEGCVHAEL